MGSVNTKKGYRKLFSLHCRHRSLESCSFSLDLVKFVLRMPVVT